MPAVCFYFQVHQPYRLRRYSVFDSDRHYFDERLNGELMRKIAGRCYLPANDVLLRIIRQYQGEFHIAFCISGMALEQFERHAPQVIEGFHGVPYDRPHQRIRETIEICRLVWQRDDRRAK